MNMCIISGYTLYIEYTFIIHLLYTNYTKEMGVKYYNDYGG